MNINLIKLKSVVQELRGIRSALERLADCWEMDMADRGFVVRAPATNKVEPSMDYVDEEMDWARENIDFVKRQERRMAEEENA